MTNLTDSQIVQTLEIIARVDRLPTRDIFLCQDKLANALATLKTINDDIERLKRENFMLHNQVD